MNGNLDDLMMQIRRAQTPADREQAYFDLVEYQQRARKRDRFVFAVCLGAAVVLMLFANKIVC